MTFKLSLMFRRRLARCSFVALALILATALPEAAPAQDLAHDWSDDYPSGGNSPEVVFDSSGNVILYGFVGLPHDFGWAVVSGLFVAKFDPNGTYLWHVAFPGHPIRHWRLATDSSDNIIISGRLYNGTTNFGGGTLDPGTAEQLFLVKFTSSGTHVWSSSFGDLQLNAYPGLKIDPSGNVIVTGSFFGDVNFGGSTLSSVAGSQDIFLVKFAPNGTHLWSRQFGDNTHQRPTSLGLDHQGNILMSGEFVGTLDLGGAIYNAPPLSFETFLASFDANGNHRWSHEYEDFAAGAPPDVIETDGIATNTEGDVLYCGTLLYDVDFGGGPLGWIPLPGGASPFLVRYDQDGNYVSGQVFPVTTPIGLTWVAPPVVDAGNNIVIGGTIGGDVDFGGGPLTPAGGELLLARFDSDGGFLWNAQYGGAGGFFGDLATNNAGDVAFGGTSSIVGIDFGAGVLNGNIYGKFDLVFPNAPLIVGIDDVDNDQGRQVRITYERANDDDPAAASPVLQYEIYRRIDPLPTSPFAAAESVEDRIARARSGGMISDASVLELGWDFVGLLPSAGTYNYTTVSPTLLDSTVTYGQHWSVFFIRAATSDPFTFFDSPPDSGYSLDNIPPTLLVIELEPELVAWEPAPEPDVDHYDVYGSLAPGLGGSGELVLLGTTTSTSLDLTGQPFYSEFCVTASDEAGNEGTPACVSYTATGIPSVHTHDSLSLVASPNPFNPSTSVRFTLPTSSPVQLSIHDTRGALVRALVNTHHTAGPHAVVWDGMNNAGQPLASGVYFARLTTDYGSLHRKLVLLK